MNLKFIENVYKFAAVSSGLGPNLKGIKRN